MTDFETVEAFKASDGKLFLDKSEAVEHEARTALLRALGNPGLVTEVMNKVLAVHAALTPLVDFIRAQASPMGEQR